MYCLLLLSLTRNMFDKVGWTTIRTINICLCTYGIVLVGERAHRSSFLYKSSSCQGAAHLVLACQLTTQQ